VGCPESAAPGEGGEPTLCHHRGDRRRGPSAGTITVRRTLAAVAWRALEGRGAGWTGRRASEYGEFSPRKVSRATGKVARSSREIRPGSCGHGVSRMARGDLGCNRRRSPGLEPAWRAPLRDALEGCAIFRSRHARNRLGDAAFNDRGRGATPRKSRALTPAAEPAIPPPPPAARAILAPARGARAHAPTSAVCAPRFHGRWLRQNAMLIVHERGCSSTSCPNRRTVAVHAVRGFLLGACSRELLEPSGGQPRRARVESSGSRGRSRNIPGTEGDGPQGVAQRGCARRAADPPKDRSPRRVHTLVGQRAFGSGPAFEIELVDHGRSAGPVRRGRMGAAT